MLSNNVAPPNAQFLYWLAWKGRVKTTDLLQRFRVLSYSMENLCPFCKSQAESMEHIFLLCPEVWKVWSNLLQLWGFSWVTPASVEGVLQWWLGTIFKKTMLKVWRLVPVAMLWSVWRLRNDCIFNGCQYILDELCERVKVRVGMWVKSNLNGVPYSVHDIVENLNQVRLCL